MAPIPDYPNIVNENGDQFNLKDFLDTKNMDPKFGLPFFNEE